MFPTVGAALLFSQISATIAKQAFCVAIVSLICRYCAGLVSSIEPKYRFKEQLTMAATILPKATITAAFGTQFYTDAKSKHFSQEYLDAGIMVQTTAIVAIFISAPLASILIPQFVRNFLH